MNWKDQHLEVCHYHKLQKQCLRTEPFHQTYYVCSVVLHKILEHLKRYPHRIVLLPNGKIYSQCVHLTNAELQWAAKIFILYKLNLATNELLAWLSTLGGGWSALGDYSQSAAHKSLEVSLEQLKLANKLGFKNLISTCRSVPIYLSLQFV